MNPELKSATSVAPRLLARSLTGVRVLLLIAAATVLNACGGGGGAETISSNPISVSGRVIDGYISGATVFWDCNNNTTLDAGEKFTITTQGGNYLIVPAPSTSCDLLAYVPESAIDEDNPSGPIGYSYTMAAVSGKYDVISPLTTLVMGKIKSGEATSAQAGDGLISSQFGLSGSMLIDYKASTLDGISKSLAAFAKLAAKELSNYPYGNPLPQITSPVNANLSVANSTPGFGESVKMGVVPYIFKPDPVTRMFKDWGMKPSTKYIVLRDKYDVANNTLIDTIADSLTQAHGAEYGLVDFWKLSTSQMEPWTMQFSVPADRLSKIKDIQTVRSDNFKAASTLWKTTIADDIGFINYMKNNPVKAADFALETGAEVINLSIDAISILNFGATTVLRDKLVQLVKANKRLDQIKKIKTYLSDPSTCLIQTEAILSDIEKGSSGSVIGEQIPKLISGCKGLISNILKDAKVIRSSVKISSDIKALKSAGKLLLVEKDMYSLQMGKTTDSVTVANLKNLKQIIEIFNDILSLVDNPGPIAQFSSGVDVCIQYLDAYINGAELGEAVIKSNAVISASAEKRYSDEASNLYQAYYASFWTLFSDYFKVVDTTTDTYVRTISWAGGQMTLGLPTLITVTGGNLPATVVLTIEGGNCQAPSSRGIGALTAICTVTNSTGVKKLSVLTNTSANGGLVISDMFAANVIGVLCAEPQLLVNGLCVSPSLFNVTPTTATASTATTFTITGQNLPLTAVMALADGTCQTQTSPAQTATGFTVVCTPGSTTGSKLVTISTAMGGTVIDASRSITVSSVPVIPQSSGTGLLTDTGITANQCYQAGSDVLVSCTSAAAIALNASQDGMIGRDVSSPSNTDGKLGFSYSTVPNPAGGRFDLTECVKDNITGLTWEGKTATGTRAGVNGYNNVGNSQSGDASAYVTAVNTSALCGYTDWRMPTVDELQSLVDYGVAYPGPTINTIWFPNTISSYYWAVSPFVGYAAFAWVVSFIGGEDNAGSRGGAYLVRLVR